MRIPSSEIPQADKLDDVVRVAEAVKSGYRTYQDIASYLDKVERQGRYYRLAAEIIGLIESQDNYARLTKEGKRIIVASNPKEQKKALLELILSTRLFQRMLPFFENHKTGITRHELEKFMEKVTQPVGATMMIRRASTATSWLKELGVIKQVKDLFIVNPTVFNNIPKIEFKITEPLLPKVENLKEYQLVEERTRANRAVQFMVNDVARERADNAHRRLVNLVSVRLNKAGVVARYNKLVDLAARVENTPFLFEMKSITRKNAHAQIRRSIGQLYEYRFLQNITDAKLVVVVENELPNDTKWMNEYLEEDRGIHLIWDGDNKLYASKKTKKALPFLQLE